MTSQTATTPARIGVAERRARALDLRKRGLSFWEISQELGCSKSRAHDYVTRAIADLTVEGAEAVRRLEVERCDVMIKALWPDVESGDPVAIRTALRVMERRARYQGLDAPQEHRLKITAELDAQIEELLASMDAVGAPAPVGHEG